MLKILLGPIDRHHNTFLSKMLRRPRPVPASFSLVGPLQPSLQLDVSFLPPFFSPMSHGRGFLWLQDTVLRHFLTCSPQEWKEEAGSVSDWLWIVFAGAVETLRMNLLFITVEGSSMS